MYVTGAFVDLTSTTVVRSPSLRFSPNAMPWRDTRQRAKGQPPHSLSSLPPHGAHRVLQLLALLSVRNAFAIYRIIAAIASSAYRGCVTSHVHARYEALACGSFRYICSWSTWPKFGLIYTLPRLVECHIALGKRMHAPYPRPSLAPSLQA